MPFLGTRCLLVPHQLVLWILSFPAPHPLAPGYSHTSESVGYLALPRNKMKFFFSSTLDDSLILIAIGLIQSVVLSMGSQVTVQGPLWTSLSCSGKGSYGALLPGQHT